MLIYLITKKLDFASERAWEEYIISKKIISPTITDDLIKFLNQRCQLLEAISREKTEKSVKSENNLVNFKKPSNSRSDAGSKSFSGHVQQLSCAFCKREHLIYYCDKLKSMPPDSRLREVNKMKRCTNCLRRGHSKSDCRSQGCKKCNGRHNTLLHDDSLRNPPATSGVARSGGQNASNSQIQGSDSVCIVHGNNDDNSVQSAGLAVNHCRNLEPQILLSTANILIKDGSNRWHEQWLATQFYHYKAMSQLRLDSTDAGIPVIGVGNSTTRIAKRVRTEIKSLNNDYSVKLTFLVLDEITECMPNFPFNKTELKIPKTVKLADSNFYLSSTIDILLGAGIFFDLLCSGRIKLGENLPVLQQTLLGWIISGPLPREMNSSSNFCNLAIEASLDKQIEKFWLLEEVTTQKPQSREEIECENVFVETTRRDDSGHFVVTLPTRENVHDLGENLTNAVQRLYAMERKFSENVEFKQLYTSFMNEYERLGHMTRINESELHSTTSRGTFYLPHHGVIKNESTTTKLRVVFDGSCKSSTGLSLNDTLKVGPKLQDDLVDILIRFRKHSYVIVADVEKMYRQVKIDENQRDLQRIVWRKNETDEIGHYRLNTVTYGTASASFLAVRSLQQVAHEHHESYPHAAEAILSDFYVDDLITGANDIESTINLKHDISILLDSYGFPLRKWLSNSPHILEDSIDNDNCYIMSDDDTRKTLAPPNTWKLFVSNRISKIQGSTDVSQWKHVASADNPADLVSRGISASQLPSRKIWWHGPVWLNKSEKEWPEPLYQARNKIEIEHVPEKRHLQVSLIAKHDFSILDRYSSLYRLQKIVAFCFRFTYNASNSFGERKSGAITVDEMNHALLALVKLAQHQDFSQEINCLFEKEPLPKGSRLLNLDPFLDTNGYLRVGGRLSNQTYRLTLNIR
nr:unnamed protein product [Callosobruchus chinensis]